MAKAKGDMTGPIIALVGALVYLYVLYEWTKGGATFGVGSWGGTSAAFWLPVFAGLGAAAVFNLLLISLWGIMGPVGDKAVDWTMKANFMAAIALFGLTAGGGWFWLVAVGALLGQFGAARQKMG